MLTSSAGLRLRRTAVLSWTCVECYLFCAQECVPRNSISRWELESPVGRLLWFTDEVASALDVYIPGFAWHLIPLCISCIWIWIGIKWMNC